MGKRGVLFLVYIIILISIVVALYQFRPAKQSIIDTTTVPSPHVTPTPTPYIFTKYELPQVAQKQTYKIAMVGDSMTAALGPHGGELSEYLNELYTDTKDDTQRIIIDNYAKSSNILAIHDQLNKKTTISEYTFGPLLSQDYDILLIESFGYNPLSQYGTEMGIKRQSEELVNLMTKLKNEKPNMGVIFIATIAPNIKNYATDTQPDNSSEERGKQAEERILYIKNHIEFAKSHNIPLINIYDKSLTETGDGNLKYINSNDDIHPSFSGIDFISREIGDFIYNNKTLPE